MTVWGLAIGERYVMLVLPSGQPPTIGLLNQQNRERIRLASEAEIQHLFPDCDPRAVPPCGEPYGVPVYISDELANVQGFVCAGGRSGTWLRLGRRAFDRLVAPLADAPAQGLRLLMPLPPRLSNECPPLAAR